MAGFLRGEHFDVNKDIPDLAGRVSTSKAIAALSEAKN
jgi:hypothetical protein